MHDYNCRNCGHIFDQLEVIRGHMRGHCDPAVVQVTLSAVARPPAVVVGGERVKIGRRW
jgi:predicted dithiol-disulfide oxidoreductase (DUF899 family)